MTRLFREVVPTLSVLQSFQTGLNRGDDASKTRVCWSDSEKARILRALRQLASVAPKTSLSYLGISRVGCHKSRKMAKGMFSALPSLKCIHLDEVDGNQMITASAVTREYTRGENGSVVEAADLWEVDDDGQMCCMSIFCFPSIVHL